MTRTTETPFVGRDADITAVGALLTEGVFVTLVGPGGIGKTRLAREIVARRTAGGSSNALWVDLSTLSAPIQLDASPLDADEPALLVLDGCEHLAAAVPRLVESIRPVRAALTVLATSRVPLDAPDERVHPVGPLPEADAVVLFRECARGARGTEPFEPRRGDEEAMARICRRLGGRPVAIEVAAARVATLTPEEIADRLDDALEILTAGRVDDTLDPSPRTLLTTAAMGGWPALRVRALGPLEIHRFGAWLPPGAWRYARPRELLLYLLCHPEGRSRAQIGVAFWPDASPAQAKNNVHVALHRLRDVLEDPTWILLEHGVYRIHPELVVDFDADRFEQEMRSHRPGEVIEPASPDQGERLAACLALYRGEFLETENVGDWHLARRDRLARLFVRGQTFLGDLLMASGDLGAASAAFRRVIDVEPFHEGAVRGYMRATAGSGDRAAALRAWERLEVGLREELDAVPEPETAGLADRLRKNLAL